MNKSDWDRQQAIFHEVVALSVEKRGQYLAVHCPEGTAMRSEIDSLVLAFDQNPEILQRPVASAGARLLTGEFDREGMIGRSFGPYEILKPLGRGGMGEVYLAHDTMLERQVALKFLSRRFIDDAWAKQQLIKEARAIAPLNDPSICTLYDLEDIDGHSFLVMQYVEGETLASLISAGSIQRQQMVSLAIQIVKALKNAHSHGIIHRDIKPQNIMVTARGEVSVLDFGLAKVTQQSEGGPFGPSGDRKDSQAGNVIGTLDYMSPEQLRAEELDFRSDIFSFGMVLYEMIGGKSPYWGSTNEETRAALLSVALPPLINGRKSVPAGLIPIAKTCVRKNRAERYQSAEALLKDLERINRSRFRSRARIAAPALMLLIAAIAIWYVFFFGTQTMALLPIIIDGSDANGESAQYASYLDQTLPDDFSRIPKLKIKTVGTSPFASDKSLDFQKLRETNSDVAMIGRIRQRNGTTFLQINLFDIGNGTRKWLYEFEVRPDNMEFLSRDISVWVASSLHLPIDENERSRMMARQATLEHRDPTAYELYFNGRSYWNDRDDKNIRKAIAYFTEATKLDPKYARAYSGLADSYILLTTVAYGVPKDSDAINRAKYAAQKAIELDPTLSQAHASNGTLLLMTDWDWKGAEAEFRKAIDLDPDYAPAHVSYSLLLMYAGHFDEAIAESEKAKNLEPYSPYSYMHLGRAYYFARQYDRAADYCLKALEMNRNYSQAKYMLGFVYLQTGKLKEATALFTEIYDQNKAYGVAALGYTYAITGRRDKAMEMLNVIDELSKNLPNPLPPQEKGIIYAGLGDKDQMFKLLQQSCTDHFASFPPLMITPLFDRFHQDPRFQELRKCVNLPQ